MIHCPHYLQLHSENSGIRAIGARPPRGTTLATVNKSGRQKVAIAARPGLGDETIQTTKREVLVDAVRVRGAPDRTLDRILEQA